ncbi:restriction endonuclease subunit S [Cyclobacterium roseum]|uniref:restriction endonuclease subunit S n=1 Tax=Cyclobacterium roseum TaxID=2666137 RepID=UPI001390DFED|nr:restriction endonuclease subunit S [Cyclobacterium roseum]
MKLLEHFKELTLHPKNAQELKGLILQLAVQGKLTRQWREEHPDVEPASDLLERIKDEKEKLVKEKKIKKENHLPKVLDEEAPYELPKSWIWCTLGDLNREIHYGYTASALHTFSGIRMLRITDIQDNKVNWDRVPDCDIKEKDFLKYKLEENDILIARTGGTIGKSFQVKGVNVNSVFASYLIRAIPMKQVFPGYIKQWLESPIYWKQLTENSQGTGQPNVNATALKGLAVSLPPLEEQKAIVEVVNQLFAEVEQLETLTKERIKLKADFVTSALSWLTQAAEQDTASQWAFLQEHFGTFFTEKESVKKVREGILQLAVQGRLTHHWRSLRQDQGIQVEQASTLLEKIKAEKEQLIKTGKIKKEKPLPEISDDEVHYELPEGWVWCRFQEIFDIRDGTHDSPKDAFGSDTFPLITSKNFNNGKIDFNTARRISSEDYLKVIQRSQVHKGDILFSMIGGNIGNQVEVGGFTEFAIKNVALFKHYRYGLPSEGFLKFFSQYIALSLQGEAAGGAQPFVSLKFFRNLIVGLPPKEEQKAIVEKVNVLMALCDKLEQEIEIHQTIQEQWMQRCLREVVNAKTPDELHLNLAAEPIPRYGNK